jgi:hypothetical protein
MPYNSSVVSDNSAYLRFLPARGVVLYPLAAVFFGLAGLAAAEACGSSCPMLAATGAALPGLASPSGEPKVEEVWVGPGSAMVVVIAWSTYLCLGQY